MSGSRQTLSAVTRRSIAVEARENRSLAHDQRRLKEYKEAQRRKATNARHKQIDENKADVAGPVAEAAGYGRTRCHSSGNVGLFWLCLSSTSSIMDLKQLYVHNSGYNGPHLHQFTNLGIMLNIMVAS